LINKIRECLKVSYPTVEPEAPARDIVVLLM
jgi:hypothetical protein